MNSRLQTEMTIFSLLSLHAQRVFANESTGSCMQYNELPYINYVAFKQVGVKTSKHLGTPFILYGLFWKVPQEMSRHVLENQVEI